MAAKDVPNGDFCAYIDKLQEEKLAQFKSAVQKDAAELKEELRLSQAQKHQSASDSLNAALRGAPFNSSEKSLDDRTGASLLNSYSQTVNAARGERVSPSEAGSRRRGRVVPPNYTPLTQREMREAPNEFRAATAPPSTPAKGPLKLIGLIFFLIAFVYMVLIAVFTTLAGAPPVVMFALTAAGLICMIIALQLVRRRQLSRSDKRPR
ncbi:MAG TPA: hypothetical protein IAB18_07325 [Candidatus Avisuccinivibrio pullicola]|nr:hypothetical protein [Candidatus Avisuccinivibrio pullicola]